MTRHNPVPPHRRALLRAAAVGGGALLGGAATLAGAPRAGAFSDDDFRWCSRCQGMWYAAGDDNGHCPVHHWWDHSHYQDGSARYWFTDGAFDDHSVDQHGVRLLRICRTCKIMFREDVPNVCPNNAAGHSPTGPAFAVEANFTGALSGFPKQAGWRRCVNCAAIFFVDNGVSSTHCPVHQGSGTEWHSAATIFLGGTWHFEEYFMRFR